MAKTSDWKIVATEGPAVDGRKITREWLTEIAENYALSEFTALIWPEHKRFALVTEVTGAKYLRLKLKKWMGKNALVCQT